MDQRLAVPYSVLQHWHVVCSILENDSLHACDRRQQELIWDKLPLRKGDCQLIFRRKLLPGYSMFLRFSESCIDTIDLHLPIMPKSRAGRGILITSNLPQLQNLIKVSLCPSYVHPELML